MSKTIFKYVISSSELAIKIPVGAKPLSVQVQNGTPCLWCEVDKDAPNQLRGFKVVGTGHEIDFDLTAFSYVGTFQIYGGSLVFHLYLEN